MAVYTTLFSATDAELEERFDSDRERLDMSEQEIRLHWSYFAQLDPALVLGVLRELRLRAVSA